MRNVINMLPIETPKMANYFLYMYNFTQDYNFQKKIS